MDFRYAKLRAEAAERLENTSCCSTLTEGCCAVASSCWQHSCQTCNEFEHTLDDNLEEHPTRLTCNKNFFVTAALLLVLFLLLYVSYNIEFSHAKGFDQPGKYFIDQTLPSHHSPTFQANGHTTRTSRKILELPDTRKDEANNLDRERRAVKQLVAQASQERKKQKWWTALPETRYYKVATTTTSAKKAMDPMDFYLLGDVTWVNDKVTALVDTVGAAMALGRIVVLIDPLQVIPLQETDDEGADRNKKNEEVLWNRYYDISDLLQVHEFVDGPTFHRLWDGVSSSWKKEGYCNNFYQLSSKKQGNVGWGGTGATPQKMLAKGIYCLTKQVTAFPMDAKNPGKPYTDKSIWEETWGNWDEYTIRRQLGPLDERLLVVLTPLHMYQFDKAQQEMRKAIACRIQFSTQVREEAYRAMFRMGLLSSTSSSEVERVPFACVHYRRGDNFMKPCDSKLPDASCWQTPAQAAQGIGKLVNKYRTNLLVQRSGTASFNLFMMTNEEINRNDWEVFLKALQLQKQQLTTKQKDTAGNTTTTTTTNTGSGEKVEIVVHVYKPIPQHQQRGDQLFNSLVEQSICADSQAFLRNGWSSFSQQIHHERVCRGFAPETSSRWGELH